MLYRVGILSTITVLLLLGCSKKETEPPKEFQAQQEIAQAHGAGPANQAAGVAWTIPSRWIILPPRAMRVASYGIPATDAGGEAGECGVFFFGSGQGGDIDANIERWVSQFETREQPSRASKEVNGLKVTLIQIAGTYLSPGGPMMQSQGKKENFRLLGAIVGAPEGSVFFKLTGPAKTIAAAQGDFDALVSSMKKQ